jgi:FkbM family methyltransferase
MQSILTSQLIFGQDRDGAIIQSLRWQASVLIYGNGDVAESICHQLLRYGISPAAFVVDAPFASSAKSTISNIPLLTLPDALTKYPNAKVIIGFADYKKGIESLNAYGVEGTCLTFDLHTNPITRDAVMRQLADYESTYNLYADEESRYIFVACLNTQINKNAEFMFDVPTLAERGQNIYFKNDLVKLSRQECYLNVGAFRGEDIAGFLQEVGENYATIFALEPEEKNFRELQSVAHQNDKTHLFQIGAWNKAETLYLDNKSGTLQGCLPTSQKTERSIQLDTIDKILGGQSVSHMTININGAEPEAIQGATNTIRQSRPRIVCYLLNDNIMRLPLLLNAIAPDYKFFLRAGTNLALRTFFYAIPKEMLP